MRDLNQVLGGYVAPGPAHAYPVSVEYRPVDLATPPAPVLVYMPVVPCVKRRPDERSIVAPPPPAPPRP